MEILVIGPNPSCIRCTTTAKRAMEVARQLPGTGIEVRSIKIPSPETERYGKVECGHTIESIGNVEPDFDSMHRLLDELDILEVDEEKNASQIDDRLKKLDEVLAPVRTRAEELGYFMTPVLVVNDKVKSAGYVPAQDEIHRWVQSEISG